MAFNFAIFVAGVSDEQRLRGLLTVLVVSAIAINLYALSYILHTAGCLPDALYIPLEQGQDVGFYEGMLNLF
jgi:hypothetical protein